MQRGQTYPFPGRSSGLYGWFLVGIIGCIGYFVFRKTKRYWMRLLFPVGYYLYTTRLGYRLHLRRLSKKRHGPHSITQPLSLSGVTIIPLAILDDNYCYVVVDDTSRIAVAIDAADPEAVKRCVQEKNLLLKALLTTHKHWDHSGGNEALKREFRDLAVYGGAKETVPGATHLVQDRDIIKISKLTFEAVWTPGHTKGHVVYVLQNSPPCIFTGDHLFVGGTGRMFECTAETMMHSIKRITTLPHNSLIFPGHEYAWMNIRFINSLQSGHLPSSNPEGSDIEISKKYHWVYQQVTRQIAAIPAVLADELRYSPYLRTGMSSVKDLVGLSHQTSEVQVLAELRRRKNLFT